MSLLAWIVGFCLLGGVLSVIAASGFLLLPEAVRTRLLPHFVSFAIGALLGAAFLTLLPHAMAAPAVVDVHHVTTTVLLGVLGFFLLEKMVLWRHCHDEVCEVHVPMHEGGQESAQDNHHHSETHTHPAGILILVGDGLHNFVDGVLIAAAFFTDIHVGVVTSVAVAAHEIPQEVGDFSILLQSGFSRARALAYNVLSSLTTVVGGLLAYVSLAAVQVAIPYVLAVAAASFIYIAVADLIPGLHRRAQFRVTLQQVSLILLGVLVIYVAHSTLH